MEVTMKDYQDQIIMIVRKMKNVTYLKMLLGFAKELHKKEKEET